MATVEVTFYKGIPDREIPIPGGELVTADSSAFTNATSGFVDVPSDAKVACFTLAAASRAIVLSANVSGEPSKIAPKNRLFAPGVNHWLGVPPGGKIKFILEV